MSTPGDNLSSVSDFESLIEMEQLSFRTPANDVDPQLTRPVVGKLFMSECNSNKISMPRLARLLLCVFVLAWLEGPRALRFGKKLMFMH